MADKDKFFCKVLWGESPEPTDSPVEYGFETLEEMRGFLYGIREAIGWMDCQTWVRGEDSDYDTAGPEARGN